jgi:hypothetical protein
MRGGRGKKGGKAERKGEENGEGLSGVKSSWHGIVMRISMTVN